MPLSQRRYEPADRDDTAEVAFVVQDGWQNRGLDLLLRFTDVLEHTLEAGIVTVLTTLRNPVARTSPGQPPSQR